MKINIIAKTINAGAVIYQVKNSGLIWVKTYKTLNQLNWQYCMQDIKIQQSAPLNDAETFIESEGI